MRRSRATSAQQVSLFEQPSLQLNNSACLIQVFFCLPVELPSILSAHTPPPAKLLTGYRGVFLVIPFACRC